VATEPPPTAWVFPPASQADEHGVVGVGADLEPGTLLAAYRSGLFPMPIGRRRLAWWSPDPRGVLPIDGLAVSRSLRKACSRFEVRVDSAFDAVVDACADPRRPHGWINRDIRRAYGGLHALGWAHSVETWLDGVLVGGLYGVAIGGLFAGESMFHRETDASKVALVGLVALLDQHPDTLVDVQWATPHLCSLGVVEVARSSYLRRLARAVARPLPAAFAGDGAAPRDSACGQPAQ
jgi:leucyl/phenylalanyl-tRNA--protein transferase